MVVAFFRSVFLPVMATYMFSLFFDMSILEVGSGEIDGGSRGTRLGAPQRRDMTRKCKSLEAIVALRLVARADTHKGQRRDKHVTKGIASNADAHVSR